MNVAIFASSFYPHIGGVEELVRQLARSYRNEGITTIVLTNRWPRYLPVYEECDGIPVYRVPMRMPEGSTKAILTHTLTHQVIRAKIRKILRRHHIDLLHVQCVSTNAYCALQAHRELNLPLVVTCQGELTMDANRLYERSPFMNQVLNDALHEAVFVTACSAKTLADLNERRASLTAGKSVVIHNGIDPTDFEHATAHCHPRPYLFAIGRLVHQKGFDILIEGYRQLDPGVPDLIIAGDGPEASVLASRIQKNQLSSRVHLFGRASRLQVAALMKGCEFFVLPSREEPFGIVNLEAMAAGKAVVAFSVGGVGEVIEDGINGILVPPENAGMLAAAMLRLFRDDQMRQKLARSAVVHAAKFNWCIIAREYIDIYNRAVAGYSACNLVSAPLRLDSGQSLTG